MKDVDLVVIIRKTLREAGDITHSKFSVRVYVVRCIDVTSHTNSRLFFSETVSQPAILKFGIHQTKAIHYNIVRKLSGLCRKTGETSKCDNRHKLWHSVTKA